VLSVATGLFTCRVTNEINVLFVVHISWALLIHRTNACLELQVLDLKVKKCVGNVYGRLLYPKGRTFAYKTTSNALATEKNKRSRGIEVTGICVICRIEQEDTIQALYKYPHARQLWILFGLQLGSSPYSL
jgi:hypothetical protein